MTTTLSTDRGDAALVAGVRRGDVAAFVELTRRHEPAMRRLARVLDPERLAGDLAGDALVLACTSLTAGVGPALAVRPYLLSLVRHLHRFRSSGLVAPMLAEDTVVPTRPFADHPLHPGPANALLAEVATMPEGWQAVFWHLDVEHESPVRVARFLGVDPATVLSLATQVRAALRGLLPCGAGTPARVVASHLLGDAAHEYLTLTGAAHAVPSQRQPVRVETSLRVEVKPRASAR